MVEIKTKWERESDQKPGAECAWEEDSRIKASAEAATTHGLQVPPTVVVAG